MDAKERVYQQIAHRETDFIPYVLDMFDEVGQALDTHYGSDAWRTKVDNQIHKLNVWRLPWNVEAPRVRSPYGAIWRTDHKPAHVEAPALSVPSLAGYRFPSPQEVLVDGYREKVSEARQRHSDRFFVVMWGSGIFETSWYLRGMENALADAVADPGFYDELTSAIGEHLLELVQPLLDLPIDGLMIGDDWGYQRGLFLGAERWRRFMKPHLKRIYDRIHSAGKVTVTHCCGCITDIVPDLIEIGLDVLESVQPEAMDPYMLKREYGKDITFWGGLGSQSTLPFGTPADIRREVHRLCREMGAGGGYILATAKSLRPEMPVENAAATVEAFLEQAGVMV